MKRRIKLLSLLLSVTLLLSGCANSVNSSKTNQVSTPQVINVKEEQRQSGSKQNTKTISIGKDFYYLYNNLDSGHKKVYSEILESLSTMGKEVKVSTVNKKVLDKAFMCVMNDHPELFYVSGYQYTQEWSEEGVTGILFSGAYTMSKEDVIKYKQAIDKRVNSCLSKMPVSDDEYDTIKYLYEWVIQNTEYDKSVKDNQTICSVFLGGRSVCNGYAKSLQYLLQKLGIQCVLVTGYANNERHAWNIVRINGKYYHIDPTWGDASYSYKQIKSSDSDIPEINYDYFLITKNEVLRTHSYEEIVRLPDCSTKDDNYFVKEGLLLDSYNEELLSRIFGSETAKSTGCVSLKCSSESCYDTTLIKLISWNQVFKFTGNKDASISYTSNDQQRIISFWNIY